jgi:hypothetical protein
MRLRLPAVLFAACFGCAQPKPAPSVAATEPVVPAATPTPPAECPSVPAPAPAYPARYPRLGEAELTKRAADLRRASRGLLDTIDLDPYGFVNAIDTQPIGHLPEGPVRIDLENGKSWMEWARCTPALFGAFDDALAHLFVDRGGYLEAEQRVSGQKIGRVLISPRTDFVLPAGAPEGPRARMWNVHIQGHFWPGVTIPTSTKIGAADVEAKLVGATYDSLLVYGPPPCPQGQFAPPKCEPPPPVRAVVTVTREMIHTHDSILVVRASELAPLEIRRVLRVDLAGATSFSPRSGGLPIPYIVDAVTGEDLGAWQWCSVVAGATCQAWSWCGNDSCGPI